MEKLLNDTSTPHYQLRAAQAEETNSSKMPIKSPQAGETNSSKILREISPHIFIILCGISW